MLSESNSNPSPQRKLQRWFSTKICWFEMCVRYNCMTRSTGFRRHFAVWIIELRIFQNFNTTQHDRIVFQAIHWQNTADLSQHFTNESVPVQTWMTDEFGACLAATTSIFLQGPVAAHHFIYTVKTMSVLLRTGFCLCPSWMLASALQSWRTKRIHFQQKKVWKVVPELEIENMTVLSPLEICPF